MFDTTYRQEKILQKAFLFLFFCACVCIYVCKTSLKEVSPDSDSEAIMSCNYICHLLGYRVTRKHKRVYTFASKQMKNEGESWRTVGLNRLKLLLESSRAVRPVLARVFIVSGRKENRTKQSKWAQCSVLFYSCICNVSLYSQSLNQWQVSNKTCWKYYGLKL